MIHVDETDPVGEVESSFPYRDVTIRRGVDAKEFYSLKTEIGRGKFGTVYRCQEIATGTEMAAKFIPIPKRDDRRNVEREVDIMNKLQHPRIIQLYDAFEYGKMMCVVLELIEGGELFDRVIDDGFFLSERACIIFVRQLCEALEFIHRNNILHLDLKPENILCLTREGNRIKIIDFGLARQYDADKKLQVLFGTPEFVAPEVVNFDRISFGTDMWSLGVICYVLLSGLSPFMGETDIATMANVTIAKYDFDDDAFGEVSTEAIDFIKRLLLKDSSARMTASECLDHKWLKRKLQRPSPPPKPTIVPPPKYTTIPASPTAELEMSKDNLKSFVERWGEHPNSPYIFDQAAHEITPPDVHRLTIERAGSILSSNGCSPSPCGSLSDPNDLMHRSMENGGDGDEPTLPNADHRDNATTPTAEQILKPCENNTATNDECTIFDNDESEKPLSTAASQLRDYLQSFERRNSDSTYIMKRTDSTEQINLADEIRKLSDRLLMLSSLNLSHDRDDGEPPLLSPDKTQIKPDKIDTTKQLSPPATTPTTPKLCETTECTTTTRAVTKITTGKTFMRTTSTATSGTASRLSERLQKTLDETPTILRKNVDINVTPPTISTELTMCRERTEQAIENALSLHRSPSIPIKCKTTTTCTSFNVTGGVHRFTTEAPFHSGSLGAPWPVHRRTKYRITQMSRDVPIHSPDSHQTIFIEQAANTTKDCLLHLLEKYNDCNEAKAHSVGGVTGRHQSISGDWSFANNLEQRSMHSLNTFFQRHAGAGTLVRQKRDKLEDTRRHPI